MPPLCISCRDKVFMRLPYCLVCLRKMHDARWLDWVPDLARAYQAPQTWSLFRMHAGFGDFVHGLKYADFPQGAALMASWARKCENPFGAGIDAIVPVPLHRTRLRERGFNQSLRLAMTLAAHWGLPVKKDFLVRRKYTATQTRQDENGRASNMEQAFICLDENKIRGKTFIVVDDVTTTGATLGACQSALRVAGAHQVYGLTLAWVPRQAERENLGVVSGDVSGMGQDQLRVSALHMLT